MDSDQPVSAALIEQAKQALTQYDEGAVMASEVIYKIVNLYLEQQEAVSVEHEAIMRLYNS